MACGACQVLKTKCEDGCVFAPFFCFYNMGAEEFRAIHEVFGASKFKTMLQNVPVDERAQTVATISYEAAALIENPIQGCLSKVYTLTNEIAKLKQELAASYAELAACGNIDEGSSSSIPMRVQGSISRLDQGSSSSSRAQPQTQMKMNSQMFSPETP